MAGYWGGAWSSLKFSAGRAGINAGMDAASSLNWSYIHRESSPIKYRNNRAYKIMLAHVAKREAMQLVESEINKLFPKYQRYLEKQLRDYVLTQQDKNRAVLIQNQKKQIDDNEWGVVTMTGGAKIYAKDKYGTKVPEALMLYYDGEEDVVTEDFELQEIAGQKKLVKKPPITSKTLLFYDLAPRVSITSAKNVVMTTVQGRDYTRKELISGGDLKFSVTGTIVGNDMDIYPETQVQKLIQICQYGGIINVNHFQFKQFNIDKIIITDYSFGEPECKNEQPYSFSCVAVEPDEDVIVKKDTIAILNQEIQASPMSKWYKLILDNKLAEIAANIATNMASSITNASIDVLTPNI